MVQLQSGDEHFTRDDLFELCDTVAAAWSSAASGDWSVRAGTVEWSCLRTADHAVDCVYAPAFFLASRRLDRYPETGADVTMGEAATPHLLLESLSIAARMLSGVVADAAPEDHAIIFRRPEPIIGTPPDFLPRGALELILHAHDVCLGLGVPFEPSAGLCHRLREHTRTWPMWRGGWGTPGYGDDAWGDLLACAGRARA